jgi:hypothetical protein
MERSARRRERPGEEPDADPRYAPRRRLRGTFWGAVDDYLLLGLLVVPGLVLAVALIVWVGASLVMLVLFALLLIGLIYGVSNLM